MNTYATCLYFSCVLVMTLSVLKLLQYFFDEEATRNPRPMFLWAALVVSVFGIASVIYNHAEMFQWSY